MILTILGISLNLLSTLFFQFILIKETKFNDVADSYYLSLAFGLFAGSIFTSMIQYTYQKKIIRAGVINLKVVKRLVVLTAYALSVNTIVTILSILFVGLTTQKSFFSLSEIILICVIGVLQILASMGVTIGYSFGKKFVPGFSGVYPSIGSSVVFFRPTLPAILFGLSAGYILQIAHNYINGIAFWRESEKENLDFLSGKASSELVMTFQYFLLSLANFLQRIFFSSTSNMSVSMFATAEKISQTGSAILTTGFNQFTFNESNKRSQSERQNGKITKSREVRYLFLVFFIMGLAISNLGPILNQLFTFMDIDAEISAKVLDFLKPLLLATTFSAVGSLFTNKLYAHGFIRICAITGIINAALIIISLSALFFTQNLQYTAHAYALLAFINTSIKLVQWYFSIEIMQFRTAKKIVIPEVIVTISGIILVYIIFLVN